VETTAKTANPPSESQETAPSEKAEVAPQPEAKHPQPDEKKEAARPENSASKRKVPTFKRPGKRSTSIPAIPKLSTLDDLKQEVVESEKEAMANRLELNQKNVMDWWNAYKDNLTSPSAQSTFNSTEVLLKGDKLYLKVSSPMARTRILEESGLLSQLRKDFHEPKLTIEFEVEENPDLEEKPKKLMTNKEKYELLVTKNPEMKELRSKLDLMVDHDE
jgi:hypothetical protein